MAIVKVYFCKNVDSAMSYVLKDRSPDDVVDAEGCIPETAASFPPRNSMPSGNSSSPITGQAGCLLSPWMSFWICFALAVFFALPASPGRRDKK